MQSAVRGGDQRQPAEGETRVPRFQKLLHLLSQRPVPGGEDLRSLLTDLRLFLRERLECGHYGVAAHLFAEADKALEPHYRRELVEIRASVCDELKAALRRPSHAANPIEIRLLAAATARWAGKRTGSSGSGRGKKRASDKKPKSPLGSGTSHPSSASESSPSRLLPPAPASSLAVIDLTDDGREVPPPADAPAAGAAQSQPHELHVPPPSLHPLPPAAVFQPAPAPAAAPATGGSQKYVLAGAVPHHTELPPALVGGQPQQAAAPPLHAGPPQAPAVPTFADFADWPALLGSIVRFSTQMREQLIENAEQQLLDLDDIRNAFRRGGYTAADAQLVSISSQSGVRAKILAAMAPHLA